MFPGFELLSTLWTKLQLCTVTPFLARPAHVRGRSVMYFQTPQLSEAACAARKRTVKPVFILSAFDPVILGYVFRTLHSLVDKQGGVSEALSPLNDAVLLQQKRIARCSSGVFCQRLRTQACTLPATCAGGLFAAGK